METGTKKQKNKLEELGKKIAGGGEEAEAVRERWMAKHLQVRLKGGGFKELILNEAQKKLYARWGRKNIVLKARQMGITTAVAARFFLDTITRPGTLTVQVAQEQQAAEEIFRIVHRFWMKLDEGLKEGALRTSHANVRQLVFPEIDSEYRVETAADECAGRGLTIQRLHASEVALWPGDAEETLAALRAAVPPTGEVVLESTPNGAHGAFYAEWRQAEEKGVVQHFFPWWMEESYTREDAITEFNDEEEALMKEEGVTAGQIAFRRELLRDYGRLAQQEFAEDAETCFRGSGDCVFELEMIEQRMKQLEDAAGPEKRENGRIRIFLRPEEGQQYVIGVDPAGGGVDGSYAAAQVIEKKSGLQCAEMQGHWKPHELARKVAGLGKEYNEAELAVEVNNHGMVVLAELERALKYKNLYFEPNTRGELGVLTTSRSKGQMVAAMETQVRLYPEKINSLHLLRECKTMVRDAKGNARAASGSHDDLVMAYAIALRSSI